MARFSQQAELWGGFDSAEHRFRAVFGDEAIAPFKALRDIRHRVVVSARMLVRTFERRGYTGSHADEYRKQCEKWEAGIGWGAEPIDPVVTKIDDAVAAIVTVCRPAIDGYYERQGWLGTRRPRKPASDRKEPQ